VPSGRLQGEHKFSVCSLMGDTEHGPRIQIQNGSNSKNLMIIQVLKSKLGINVLV